MQQYLQIRSGRYQLLVPADGVREVLDISDDPEICSGKVHGCSLWRGISITMVNLQTLLSSGGFSSTIPNAALIYGVDEAETPVMVLCDEVIGLIQAEDDSFRPLPLQEESLARYFDKVLPDPRTGRMLLRLSGLQTDVETVLQNE